MHSTTWIYVPFAVQPVNSSLNFHAYDDVYDALNAGGVVSWSHRLKVKIQYFSQQQS